MDFSQSFLKMTGGAQHYAWGCRARQNRPPYIADLLKQPHNELPWAELWLGAHPNLPSAVTLDNGSQLSLGELISLYPRDVLGVDCLKRKFSTLPFLLKILNCEKPLSIQSHPDLATAARLHQMNPKYYPDSNHKPETIVALGDFEAMAGFRRLPDILRDLERHPGCGPWLQATQDLESLKSLCQALFALDDGTVAQILRNLQEERPAADSDFLFRKLLKSYPGDRGTLFAYLLQHFTLKPFQSLFLQPNMPHAYINGLGIECMANSDNVIRAGLTGKIIDTATLLSTVDFTVQGTVAPSAGKALRTGQTLYTPPVPEYRILTIAGTSLQFRETAGGLPGILLVLEGSFRLEPDGGSPIAAERGSAWLKPAALHAGTLTPGTDGSLAVWCTPNL